MINIHLSTLDKTQQNVKNSKIRKPGTVFYLKAQNNEEAKQILESKSLK